MICRCGCGLEAPRDKRGRPRAFIAGHLVVPDETRAKLRAAHLGRKHTDEHRAAVSRARQGRKNPAWKGGRSHRGDYAIVKLDADHPFAAMRDSQGYVPEHRLVMALAIGRVLRPEEEVHHIDDPKDDNRLENLMLFANKAEHTRHHRALERGAA